MFIKLSYNLKDGDPVFIGNPKNMVTQVNSVENDGFNTHMVKLFTHNGTHIDLPLHCDKTGKDMVSYQIDDFIFDNICFRIVDIGPDKLLRVEDVDDRCNFLLIKTGANRYSDRYHYPPYIDEDTALYLAGLPNLRCIGVDTVSIGNPKYLDISRNVHRILLGKPVFIVEDMDLSHINHSIVYKMSRIFVIPLFVEGVEGFPCTVFAEVT